MSAANPEDTTGAFNMHAVSFEAVNTFEIVHISFDLGKMRNCVLHKVKCGIRNAERCVKCGIRYAVTAVPIST